MNPLTFISHHLFVEAVAREGRTHARPARHDRPLVEPAAPVTAIPLELIAERNPLPARAAYSLRTSVGQARS